MIKLFKKLFIPHEHNDHRPHFLRRKSVLVMFVLIAIMELSLVANIFGIPPVSNFFASVLPNVIVDLTNQERAVEAKTSLERNDILDRAAQDKADDMAQKGYFAHTSPDGVTPWHWFFKEGYTFRYAGENLALNFYDSKDAVDAWMASPLHRANIVDDRFTEIGIGVADGTYEGKPAIFIVQLFGTPLASAAAAPSTVPPTTVAVAPQLEPAPVPAPSEPAPAPEPQPTPEAVTVVPSAPSEPPQEMFIATQVAGEEVAVPATSQQPATPAISHPAYASLFEHIAATPHVLSSYFLMLLGALLVLALLLKLMIRAHVQHPRLIANGIVMLALVVTVFIVNNNVLLLSGKIF